MISNSAVFLCQTILGILTFLLVLRFLMQWTRTPFQNPIGQMAMALTDFMVKPARKLIPPAKKSDISTLVLAFIVQLVQGLLISMLTIGFFSLWLLVWQAVFGVIAQIIDVFFYAILLMAILSWINPYNPVYGVLNQLSAPLLNPLRRGLPAIQGFDLSALVALILLQMISRIILPAVANTLI